MRAASGRCALSFRQRNCTARPPVDVSGALDLLIRPAAGFVRPGESPQLVILADAMHRIDRAVKRHVNPCAHKLRGNEAFGKVLESIATFKTERSHSAGQNNW